MTDVERALAASGAATSGRVKPLYFDYRSETTHWPSLPQIASCLADFVHEVSAKYGDAGGDGRVVVVAHSMGGLAVRFATSGKYAANPITPAQLLGVVTLGTPSLGSPFGGLSPWSEVSQLIEALNKHDRLGVFESRDQGTDGGACLAAHSKPDHHMPPKCAVPPYLPVPFRMSQIAGDTTIDRSLFGIHLYDIPLFSDGVVPVPSAHGYVASAPGDAPYGGYTDSDEVQCRTGFDGVWSAMMAGIVTAGGLSLKSPALARLATRSAISLVNDFETFAGLQNDDMGLGLAAFLGYTTVRSSCGHVNLTRDRASLDAMVRMVAAHLDSVPGGGPVTPQTSGYHSYTNPRFGFTCEVPAAFIRGDEPGNGDGLGFSSADGAAQVLCYGSNSQDGTPQQAFDDAVRFAQVDGSIVTYSKLTADNEFTVTGSQADGTIFYQRTVWGTGSNDTVYWTYLPAMKEQLDPAVQHSVSTLRPGDLTTAH
jgi:hypothetical protein